MLIDSGGGGTDWSSMSMDMMWLLIKSPDTEAYYHMLDGWKRSYELLNAHKWQVKSYRDALATAWPPEKSDAANAYVQRLNEMIDNLDQTYEAAMQNHRAFADATLSIGLAQSDFDKLYQEYSNNQTLLNAFESKMAADTTSTEKSKPPVADGRQEALRQQAAIRLSSVSTDLAQAQAQIRQPAKYQLQPGVVEPGKTNDGTSYVPPPIPPITPSYPTNDSVGDKSKRPSITFPTGGGGSGYGGNPGSTPVTTQPAPNLPVTAQPVVNPQQPGLVLGGTGGPVAAPPTVGGPPTPPVTGPHTTLPTPGTSPFLPTGSTSVGLPKQGTQRIQQVTGEHSLRSPGFSEGLRAMPPGGIIGAPSSKTPQPTSARPGMRRVNPVGGMIGEGESNSRTVGRGTVPLGGEPMTGSRAVAGRPAGSGSRGMPAAGRGMVGGERLAVGAHGTLPGQSYGQPGNRKSTPKDSGESQQWDPDNPWETEEGVEPVLMPPREQRIDPGPAIGLP